MRTTGLAVLALAFAPAVAAAGSASTTHFAGFPPEGVKASAPTTGRLLIGLRPTPTTTWNVYADGRVIWQKWTSAGDATVVPDGARRLDTGYVQQRLTPEGAQLLRSKILSTGLFDHNLKLELGGRHGWVLHQVRRGDRLVTVDGVSTPDPSWREHFTKATPAQTRALAWIAAFVADPAKWLPTNAWADRRIRSFVPARYVVAFDRGYPDIAKLPSPAGTVLAQYKQLKRDACQILTTGRTRKLLQALVKAGISPSYNHAWFIDFSLGRLAGQPHPSELHLSPARPEDQC
jgi:hypothetical protein